jgi:hypothetical protein
MRTEMDGAALDRAITGNQGEDSIGPDESQEAELIAALNQRTEHTGILRKAVRDALDYVEGNPCPFDSAEQWRFWLRNRLTESLRQTDLLR